MKFSRPIFISSSGWACTILVSQHYGLSGLNNCKEQTICDLKIRDRLVRSPLDVTRLFEEQEHDHDISSDAQKWASLLEGNPLRKVGNVQLIVLIRRERISAYSRPRSGLTLWCFPTCSDGKCDRQHWHFRNYRSLKSPL
ncbi:hypothetical protein OUZ56_020717 [Daphnia magna]|uniref:Uncharacterized protein n=1 Tax=Daphnia magna TaxID=35525 RepID=A0ABQ9ZF87_9CRUS|nr:hypothetical protein OUZ56_020717 [Daphnia magna]